MNGLRKARVVATYPGVAAVDLVFLDNGQRASRVQVMNGASSSGASWRVPSVAKPSSEAQSAGVEHDKQMLIAICGFSDERPIVLGFSRSINGISVAEHDRTLDVHDKSGTYETVAPDGSYEVWIPGGGYLRIGTGAHENISTKLVAGKLPSAGPSAITITLATDRGRLTLDPTGHWTLNGMHLQINAEVDIVGSLGVSGNVVVGTGATGSFTTPTGQVVTVQDGIITNIF